MLFFLAHDFGAQSFGLGSVDGLDWAYSCMCGQMLFDGGLTGLREPPEGFLSLLHVLSHSWADWACSHGGGAEFWETGKAANASQGSGLELASHHFCHILLSKADHRFR